MAKKDLMAEATEKKAKTKKKSANQTLVIVESPAKAKTIEKYLGPGYTVKASMGHLIDLPKSRIAINVEDNFQPEYITVRGKAKLLKELQKDAKKSDTVLLASDNDREGEAIAWHLKNAIQDKTEAKIGRIVFNEITPVAIKEAVKNPGEIIEAKVNAQKARRVLDRLVGYNLSPLLWSKVKNGLSAGRVQSVALRLICEREEEVENFLPEEYWTLDADFVKGKSSFTAQLVTYKGEKPVLKSESDVNNIIEEIKNAEGKNSLYRIEKDIMYTMVDPMAFDYAGLSHNSSCEKAKVKDFMSKMGFRNQGIWAFYNQGSTAFADSFLGVKYFISRFDSTDKPFIPMNNTFDTFLKE